jgi:hypothetical protein
MSKLALIALAVVSCATVAMAQTKMDTKWHCSKAATEHKIEVGDAPDHLYWIGQGTCEATGSELKEKTGVYTEFHDQWKTTFNFHGYFISTTESGEKVHYTYEGSGSTDPAKPTSNKWKIVGATGKLKGSKGSGSCSGKLGADGSNDTECTGTYTMGMGKMDSMDKMAK